MKKMLSVLLIIIVGSIISCTTTSTTQGYANTIEEAHPDRFEKTVIGMDVSDFKTIWPEAAKSGASSDGETYEFIYTRLASGGIYKMYGAYVYKIFTHFYFKNNKLVKYESSQRMM